MIARPPGHLGATLQAELHAPPPPSTSIDRHVIPDRFEHETFSDVTGDSLPIPEHELRLWPPHSGFSPHGPPFGLLAKAMNLLGRATTTSFRLVRRNQSHLVIMSYSTERAVAERAVRAAARLTNSVFEHLQAGDQLNKSDASPVTVGDFGSQAVIISLLAKAFPSIPVVGEEDAAALRGAAPEATQLRSHVTSLARKALAATAAADPPLPNENPKAHAVAEALSSAYSDDQLLDAIDRGNYEGGPRGGASPTPLRARMLTLCFDSYVGS